MAGPANGSRDASMLELPNPETTTPELALEKPSACEEEEESTTTISPLTISLSQEDHTARTSRESVLRRLSEALMRHSLAKIDLSQRGIRCSDARLVKMALSQNANLTVLKLGYNNLGDDGVATLASGIALHKSLGLLDLGFNNFGDNGATKLASGLNKAARSFDGGTVHTLYLAGNLIGESGAVAIANFIRGGSNLQKLYMTGNRIGDGGVAAITEAILEDETRGLSDFCSDAESERTTCQSKVTAGRSDQDDVKRRFAGMQELFLGGTGIGLPGCQAVARLLERSSCLKVLSLPNCDIGDYEIGILSSSFRSNKAILPVEALQLSFNKITHKGLEALSNAVWGSTTLKELKIDNNLIGDRGAHQLAAILPALKSLVTLDVGFNMIKAAGLNVLMKAVVDTDQIESLSLSGNDIDVPSAKAVAFALAYNQRLRSIYLVHCSINHEGKRHITAGAVSNAYTALRKLTGYDIGPVVVTLGFPEALKHWTNDQITNFVHLMYDKHRSKKDERQSAEERELDPLSFLQNEDKESTGTPRQSPLEASLVVEIAKSAYENLIKNGVDVFSKRRGSAEPSFGSPLASDTIMIETGALALSINDHPHQNGIDSETGMPANQARSFVAPPESGSNSNQPDIPDPARKQRIVEWLCSNIEHLNELAQLPFSPRELWRLHQHYFTPVVNETGGTVSQPGSCAASSVPEGIRDFQGSEVTPSTDSCGEVSDPTLSASPMAPASLPMLKRKVSYRFLGDAAMTSHQLHVESRADNVLRNGSIARLIEDGHTGHSLPPKTKRARRNRTRISFVPRIKARLDSYMDLCHEKALITMRQLYFVEQAILKGQVNPLDDVSQPRIHHLRGVLASEAEMIIVDMI